MNTDNVMLVLKKLTSVATDKVVLRIFSFPPNNLECARQPKTPNCLHIVPYVKANYPKYYYFLVFCKRNTDTFLKIITNITFKIPMFDAFKTI